MLTNRLKIVSPTVGFLVLAAVSFAQNDAGTKSKQSIATVAGQTIYDEDLNPTTQGQLLRLRTQEYEIKRKALDDLIEEKLLDAEAQRKRIPKEKLLDQEVNSKIPEPTEGELQAYYLALKDRYDQPFDEIKDQLRTEMKQAKIQEARQDYLKGLRADSNVVVLLTRPRVQVGYDPARLLGNPKAPVMIVEFSDFQCPYCRHVEPTLKQLLTKYPDKVSLAYRDFPLASIHPRAELAAQASRCAGEQGKFWDYHDHLFSASNLEKDTLIEYARNLKLNDKQFGSCLTSEKYKAEIDKDFQEGRKAGVSGTPGFFINGVVLSGSQPKDAFTRVIDEELERESNHPASIHISRAEH